MSLLLLAGCGVEIDLEIEDLEEQLEELGELDLGLDIDLAAGQGGGAAGGGGSAGDGSAVDGSAGDGSAGDDEASEGGDEASEGGDEASEGDDAPGSDEVSGDDVGPWTAAGWWHVWAGSDFAPFVGGQASFFLGEPWAEVWVDGTLQARDVWWEKQLGADVIVEIYDRRGEATSLGWECIVWSDATAMVCERFEEETGHPETRAYRDVMVTLMR